MQIVGMTAGWKIARVMIGRTEISRLSVPPGAAIEDIVIVMRIRDYNIEQNRFSCAVDRSTDGGTTWVKSHLQIEASVVTSSPSW
jgi:hypothetical protein